MDYRKYSYSSGNRKPENDSGEFEYFTDDPAFPTDEELDAEPEDRPKKRELTKAERRREEREKARKKKRRQLILFLSLFVFAVFFIVYVTNVLLQGDTRKQGNSSTENGTGSSDNITGSDPSDSGETDPSDSGETDPGTDQTSSQEATPTEPTQESQYLYPIAGVSANPQAGITIPSWIVQAHIGVSPKNRPGIAMPVVRNVVIHWVANPMSSAMNNRDYFDSLANPHVNPEGTSASSHFVVGLHGDIVQCVPLNEMAYANYPRNEDTISIEVCHPDWEGQFSQETYWTVVRLAAFLCESFHLTSEDVIRHHDCNGKICPKYYVEHPDAWQALKNAVGAYMIEHPDIGAEFP